MLKLFASLLLACTAAGASGQYPERALRLIVPQAPGSATDTVARILAPEMSKALGQPVLVENRPGGALTIGIDAVAKSAPDARSGKVKALAVSGARRSPGFPDLPTVAEAGVPGYEAGTWTGIIAPAGLPQAVLARLNTAVNEAIRSSLFKERFDLIGDEPAGGTPQDFVDTIKRDSARWGEVVRRSGAKID